MKVSTTVNGLELAYALSEADAALKCMNISNKHSEIIHDLRKLIAVLNTTGYVTIKIKEV